MRNKINLSQIEVNRNYNYYFDRLSIKNFMLLDLKEKIKNKEQNCIIRVSEIEMDRFEIIEGHQIFRVLKNLISEKILVDYKIEVLRDLSEIEMTKLFINDELKIRKTEEVSHYKIERLVNWKNSYEGKGAKQNKKSQPILAKELGIKYDKFGRYSQLKDFHDNIKKLLNNKICPRSLYSIFNKISYETQEKFALKVDLQGLTDKKNIEYAVNKFLNPPENEVRPETSPEIAPKIIPENEIIPEIPSEEEFKIKEEKLIKENEKLLKLNKKLEKENENLLISNSRNAIADMLAQIGTTLEDLGKIKKIFAIINTKKSFVKPQYVDKHNEIIDEIIREAKTLKIEDYTEDVMIVE